MRGGLWTMSFRWAIRLTGVASTIILARLLTPADYGVVAIAMLIVGAVEVLSQTGQNLAIVRHPNPTREHYDTAWTISVGLGATLSVIILLSTPLTVYYFHEPRAAPVVEVLAVRTFLFGFQNVGIVNFQRHLQFQRQFWFTFCPTLLSFAATIASAIVLRNYWALVIGIVTRQISTLALSYIMDPFRPRFSLSKVRDIWSFSIWTFLKMIGIYANSEIDKLAIGGSLGSAAMGRYDVARDVAVSPSGEIVTPLVTVLFPVMSTVQHLKDQRRQLYLTVFAWTTAIGIATSVGVALVGNDLVDLLLGQKWSDAKPLIPWLSLAFGILSISSSVYSAFDTLGRPDISARLQWTRVVLLALTVFPVAFFLHNLEAVAIARFVVTVLITPTLLLSLGRALDVAPVAFFNTLWRPVVSASAMAIAVIGTNSFITFIGPARLAIDVTLGVASYALCLFATWRLNGKPEGPEATALRLVRSFMS
jgi:O-antigen/teichoic acid export membrane protein